MSSPRITLFGEVQILEDGNPKLSSRTVKARELLAYLVLQKEAVQHALIQGDVWPHSTEPTQRVTKTLDQLEELLGPNRLVRRRRDGGVQVELERSGLRIDVEDFDQAIARGDIASLRDAVALYTLQGAESSTPASLLRHHSVFERLEEMHPIGGDWIGLLPGYSQPWARRARDERRRSYVEACKELASHAAVARDDEVLIRARWQIFAADPHHGPSVAALMESFDALGKRADAVRVAERYLQSRDADTADETVVALYRHFTGKHPRQKVSRKAHKIPIRPLEIPSPLSGLIGRDKDVLQVIGGLRDRRVVTLLGIGGIGKTHLALTVAKRLKDDYGDGVAYVDLTEVKGAEIPHRTLVRLGIKSTDSERPVDAVIEAIYGRSLLLLLDNCESVAADCARFVKQVTESCPDVRVLATSQHALQVPAGVQHIFLNGLAAPPRSVPASAWDGNFEEYPAVELFVERTHDRMPDWRLTPDNSATVANICRVLQGIPYALELAAGMMIGRSAEDLLAFLRKDALFRARKHGEPARRQTLQAMLDRAYELVKDEKERKLLHQLLVFRGGWTLRAAVVVWSGRAPGRETTNSGDSELEVSELLQALHGKSLIQLRGERWGMLDPLRRYLEQPNMPQLDQVSHRRHAAFYSEFLREASQKLRGKAQIAWLRRIDDDYDNICAALSSRAVGVETQLEMAGHLGPYWEVRGFYRDGCKRLGELIKRAEQSQVSDGAALARAHLVLGMLWSWRAKNKTAISHFDKAQHLAADSGDRILLVDLLNTRAQTDLDVGDFDLAERLLRQSEKLARDERYTIGQLDARFAFGWLYYRMGEFAKALEAIGDGVAGYRRNGDLRFTAEMLNIQGLVELELGMLSESQDHLLEAYDGFEAVGDIRSACYARWNLGYTFHKSAVQTHDTEEYCKAYHIYKQDYLEAVPGRDFGEMPGDAYALESIAELATNRKLWELAAQLHGAAARVWADQDPTGPTVWDRKWHDCLIADAREALGERFEAIADEAKAMDPKEVLSLGFTLLDPHFPEPAWGEEGRVLGSVSVTARVSAEVEE